MHTHDGHAQALAALARELAAAPTVHDTAEAIVQRARSAVRDADMVSVTVRRSRGRYQTLASTDSVARGLDEDQYELEEGPCVDASQGHDWRRSGDVGGDARWPRWGPRAAQAGVGSLLSVSLVGRDKTFGALNLYSHRPSAFADRDDVDLALLYGVHVGVALASSRELSGLMAAMESRHMIGAAQGIVMERFGLTLEAAFNLLVRYSSVRNVKVADVARDVVRTGRLPELAEESSDPDVT